MPRIAAISATLFFAGAANQSLLTPRSDRLAAHPCYCRPKRRISQAWLSIGSTKFLDTIQDGMVPQHDLGSATMPADVVPHASVARAHARKRRPPHHSSLPLLHGAANCFFHSVAWLLLHAARLAVNTAAVSGRVRRQHLASSCIPGLCVDKASEVFQPANAIARLAARCRFFCVPPATADNIDFS